MGLLSVVEELSFQTAPTSHLIKPTVGPYPHADHDDNGEDDYDGGHGGPGVEYDGGDGGNDDDYGGGVGGDYDGGDDGGNIVHDGTMDSGDWILMFLYFDSINATINKMAFW